MTNFVKTILFPGILAVAPLLCAQQPATAGPDTAAVSVSTPALPAYTPPTEAEKFRAYLRPTYGPGSILEAGVRGGIDQARGVPSQWPEGAEGYAERLGSAMGEIAVRGTTEYGFGEIFKEDLRRLPCGPNCSTSKFTLALEDTFTARKGSDGHLAFSVARILGPISGGLVASTWRPGGFGRRNVAKEISLNYGLVFARNLIRELARR
jgi:hypothetical protein